MTSTVSVTVQAVGDAKRLHSPDVGSLTVHYNKQDNRLYIHVCGKSALLPNANKRTTENIIDADADILRWKYR